MQTVVFSIFISADEMRRYYSGSANTVMARTEDGIQVRFPVHLLRPYVTHSGVRGRFALQFDQNHQSTGFWRID